VEVAELTPPAGAPAAAAGAWTWATVVLSVGALVSAVALAPPAAAGPTRGLAFLLFVGSSVHVASTPWLFTFRDVRTYAAARPVRYYVVPLALVLGGAAVAAAVTSRELDLLLLPFFAWQFFHFQRQNLGVVALVASSHRLCSASTAERRSIVAAGCAGTVALLCHPGLLQLPFDPQLHGVFLASAAAFVAIAWRGSALVLRRRAEDRPPAFVAAYLAALLFFLPVFVFSSPYAAVGGMTIAHGMQYLLLVGLVAAGGSHGPRRVARVAALCNTALLGGLALAVASHLHDAGPAGRLLFGAYAGVVMAHFVVDAGLWRLRDPFLRRFFAAQLPYLVPAAASPAVLPPADRSDADIR
jgi:hypothetical protein